MSAKVLCVTFDTHDPERVARFWATALGYEVDPTGRALGEVSANDPTGEGPTLYFMTVPESKSVKNRVHLDLAAEPSIEAEVARLEAAGARALASHRDPEGFPDPYRWTVMQDPEGNEFCVVEPMTEHA
jgi:predicted enzyme related to lactoylglutathione lyase